MAQDVKYIDVNASDLPQDVQVALELQREAYQAYRKTVEETNAVLRASMDVEGMDISLVYSRWGQLQLMAKPAKVKPSKPSLSEFLAQAKANGQAA